MRQEPRALARRLAAVIGVPLPVAARLDRETREQLGSGYRKRAVAFLIATSSAGRVLPRGLRRRAIASLTGPMLARPGRAALYLGLERE
jgi:hypothetical protein